MSTAANPFQKASRHKTRLRMALNGPAGSGKSYTALRFAHALAALMKERDGTDVRIAAIDTESGSLAKYVGETEDGIQWEWDGIELEDFSPSSYTSLIKIAEQNGYGVLIIDSLTHAWTGTGGALDIVDRKKAAKQNAFTDGWREVTPMHNAMIEAIIRSDMHVIATMRTKMEYVIETNEKGKAVPRKIGMNPIQRQGMEYEFDIVCDIDQESHVLTVSKSRCKAVDQAVIAKPGAAFIAPIFHWLESGANIPRQVLDAAAFKKKEPPKTALERAREQAAKKAATQQADATPEATQDAGAVASEATSQAEPLVDADTVDKIRKLMPEAFPDQDSSRRWAIVRLAEMAAPKIGELTQANAEKLVIELMERKSAEVLRRANEKLAASGTTSTVDCEPNASVKRAETEPAKTEMAGAEPAKTETANAEPVKEESAKVDQSATEPAKTEPSSHPAAEVAAVATGESATPPDAAMSTVPGTATKAQLDEASRLSEALDWQYEKQVSWLAAKGHNTFRNCSESELDDLLKKLRAKLASKNS